MNKLISVLAFVAGAAIGSVVTYKFVTAKYEEIIQEEIESVKEIYRTHNEEFEQAKKKAQEAKEKPNISEYVSVVNNLGYINEESIAEEKKEGRPNNEPYVIPPEEFDTIDGYDVESFTYYKDGVLTDTYDKPMSEDDIENLIGRESLNGFGEYCDDSVYVRNEQFKMDYEILMDQRKYSDIVPPNKVE